MNLKPFTGPGSTPSRRRFWDTVTQAVIASHKVAGQNVTVDEHPGKGTVINVPDRGPSSLVNTGACCVGTDCSITTESDCSDLGGIYQGNGTVCDPNPCEIANCPPPNPCTVDISWTMDTDNSPATSDCMGDPVPLSFSGSVEGKDLQTDPCNALDVDGYFTQCWTDSATLPNCNVNFGQQVKFYSDQPLGSLNNITPFFQLVYFLADELDTGSPAGYWIYGTIDYAFPCSPFSTYHRRTCEDWQGLDYFGFNFLGTDLSIFATDVTTSWDLYSDDTCSAITGTLTITFHPC